MYLTERLENSEKRAREFEISAIFYRKAMITWAGRFSPNGGYDADDAVRKEIDNALKGNA